jgi:GT2 family glycosyltransferase
VEVFVVDNGSVDDSVTSVREQFSEATVIQNRMNDGFAKANNQALKLSRGGYVLLLNPDTQVKEGAIRNLKAFMDHHPETGVVGAQLLNPDESKQNSIANFPSLATELLNKSVLRWLFPKTFPGKEKTYSGPIEVDSVIGACMMVRREVMEKVGLLDEDYFLFFEETDWCYRFKNAGWKIYHHPQAEIYHFQGKSAEKEKKRAKVEYYRSRYRFFKKNRGAWQWFVLLVGLLIKLGFEFFSTAIVCILTGFAVKRWRHRFLNYVHLLWWHLEGCPEGMGLK